jgi:phosphoglycolate phosphatase-like HAD superfamily hydrolase
VKQTISVIITDLDNTLFDWVEFWYASFKAMLDKLVEESGISEETLVTEFKKVHEKYGTSEYAFSIEELPSLQANFPGQDLTKKFDNAIHAFRLARKANLRLYPTVLETLEVLKDKACLIVGYTESMSFYTNYRIRKLGLDRILDYVYSPPDHDLPRGFVRGYPEERYQLRRTIPRNIPKGEFKPNPKVLLDIIKGIGAAREETIYVGDSLMKDVLMAQRAVVTDVWARYGLAQNREQYELLRRVTHWTASDVEREKTLEPEEVKPQHTLEQNFGELLEKFELTPFQDKSSKHLSLVLDTWKKTVDVQQHFNNLELTIRNFAVTVLAAVLGLAAYALKESLTITLFGFKTSIATVISLLGILPWLAFYFMDRFWYHRLLYGAVDHGEFIEHRWNRYLPEICLTDSISRYSPLTIFCWKMRTPLKIDSFYLAGIALLLLIAVASHFAIHPAVVKP